MAMHNDEIKKIVGELDLHRVQTVSYTHLDVYKRQGHCIWLSRDRQYRQLRGVMGQRKHDDADVTQKLYNGY